MKSVAFGVDLPVPQFDPELVAALMRNLAAATNRFRMRRMLHPPLLNMGMSEPVQNPCGEIQLPPPPFLLPPPPFLLPPMLPMLLVPPSEPGRLVLRQISWREVRPDPDPDPIGMAVVNPNGLRAFGLTTEDTPDTRWLRVMRPVFKEMEQLPLPFPFWCKITNPDF